ncbi:hypothetical protein [Streptomyces sp. ME19-01-6]|uniref:hypothetical protein n=1 Tax=Streptomyces sp. ME19-01-6 TaxID=3028686 RepID=UPI0039F5787A
MCEERRPGRVVGCVVLDEVEHPHRPRVVRGDGPAGCQGERFDAILLSFAVRSLPAALLEQLADGGTLVAPVTTGALGWPAQALVRRTGDTFDAVLRPVTAGHRPGSGVDLVTAPDRMPDGPVTVRPSRLAPPGEAGFWPAVGRLLPAHQRRAAVPVRPGRGLVCHRPLGRRHLGRRAHGPPEHLGRGGGRAWPLDPGGPAGQLPPRPRRSRRPAGGRRCRRTSADVAAAQPPERTRSHVPFNGWAVGLRDGRAEGTMKRLNHISSFHRASTQVKPDR